MSVDNSKNNQHKWWGTLTIDPTTTFNGAWVPKNVNGQYPPCIFIKTTWDSHTVTSGTGIKEVKLFKNLDEAKQRFNQLKPKLNDNDITAIHEDLSNIDPEFRYCLIVEVIEFVVDSPLSAELNNKTKELFENNSWRDTYGSKIGGDEIVRALKLKG